MVVKVIEGNEHKVTIPDLLQDIKKNTKIDYCGPIFTFEGIVRGKEENKDLDGAPPDPDKPKYGSDDVIYDPDQEKYVEYGDFYKEHSAIKDEQFKEDITDEELQDLIERYF